MNHRERAEHKSHAGQNLNDKQLSAIYDDVQQAKRTVNTVINGFAIFGIAGIAVLLFIILIFG